MKLHYSPSSPFVRKVMIVATERGLLQQIELLASAAHPVTRDPRIVADNPLGKVPTLVTDGGLALYDSRVICEYLDSIGSSAPLFPPSGNARWVALRDQTLADGVLDAGLLIRYESAIRPEAGRSQPWIDGQVDKIVKSLASVEGFVPAFADRCDIGTISMACMLGYLDFRFDHLQWRSACPRAAQWFETFGRRESVRQTAPKVATAA